MVVHILLLDDVMVCLSSELSIEVPAAVSRTIPITVRLMLRWRLPVMGIHVVVMVMVVVAVALMACLPRSIGRSRTLEGHRHARVERPHRSPPSHLVCGSGPGRVSQVQQGVVDGRLPQDDGVGGGVTSRSSQTRRRASGSLARGGNCRLWLLAPAAAASATPATPGGRHDAQALFL